MEITRVGVAGCGLMGSGIAQVCAQSGLETVVYEIDQAQLDRGLGRIRSLLDKDVARDKLAAAERDAILGRLHPTTRLEELAGCAVVIEAIIEQLPLKNQLFGQLDTLCPPETIFASNTSSLTIIQLASATRRPDRFAGLHFFNPVPRMALVELVRSIATSEETVAALRALGQRMGKTVVEVTDTTGFVVNRLLVPYLLDAIRVYESGIASREDIDEAMKLGCGHPMGPLTLADFVGLDTLASIADIMFDEFKEPRFAAPPLLRRMVLAGRMGKKSGRGFYEYPAE